MNAWRFRKIEDLIVAGNWHQALKEVERIEIENLPFQSQQRCLAAVKTALKMLCCPDLESLLDREKLHSLALNGIKKLCKYARELGD